MKEIRLLLKNVICSLIFLLGLFTLPTVCAQQSGSLPGSVQALSNNDLQINGGLRLSNDFYFANGIDPRRDALQWRLLTNLSLHYRGIIAPFSMAFSDGNQEFNLPSYTFAGISPSYKWATLHLGDRSLNYSKYTLTGINFRGAGFELEPGNFYVSGMYGRLRRARAEDLNSLQSLDPVYRRMGYGMKVGFQNNGSEYSLIVFSAEDDENSITQPIASTVTPAQNAVLSVIGKQKIIKNLSAEVEFAHSATNEDTRVEELTSDESDFGTTLFGLLEPNRSVVEGNAYRRRLVVSGRRFIIHGAY